jgi:hypothetical protein
MNFEADSDLVGREILSADTISIVSSRLEGGRPIFTGRQPETAHPYLQK